MKKITLSIMATLLLLMTGCANMQVTDTDMIIAQIAAKRIGFYVGQNNPEIAPLAKTVAQGIIGVENDSDMIKAAFYLGTSELAKLFPNDPLLESDLNLIVSSLKLDLPETQIDVSQVKPLIIAFCDGLEIGASHRK